MDRSHRRYRQLRARVRRDHPLCAHCAAHGLTVAGTDTPAAGGGIKVPAGCGTDTAARGFVCKQRLIDRWCG